MGTIIEFPADAALRRPGSSVAAHGEGPGAGVMGVVLILPVVRIERHPETVDGGGPEEGTTPGRRRRRRARS